MGNEIELLFNYYSRVHGEKPGHVICDVYVYFVCRYFVFWETSRSIVEIDCCRIFTVDSLLILFVQFFSLCQGLLCWQCAVPIFPPIVSASSRSMCSLSLCSVILHLIHLTIQSTAYGDIYSITCQFRVLILLLAWVAGPWPLCWGRSLFIRAA